MPLCFSPGPSFLLSWASLRGLCSLRNLTRCLTRTTIANRNKFRRKGAPSRGSRTCRTGTMRGRWLLALDLPRRGGRRRRSGAGRFAHTDRTSRRPQQSIACATDGSRRHDCSIGVFPFKRSPPRLERRLLQRVLFLRLKTGKFRKKQGTVSRLVSDSSTSKIFTMVKISCQRRKASGH